MCKVESCILCGGGEVEPIQCFEKKEQPATEKSPTLRAALPIIGQIGAFGISAILFFHGVAAHHTIEGLAGFAGLTGTGLLSLYFEYKEHRKEHEAKYLEEVVKTEWFDSDS